MWVRVLYVLVFMEIIKNSEKLYYEKGNRRKIEWFKLN